MNETKFQYFAHYRPKVSESIETRHAEVAASMSDLQPPLSWRTSPIPPVPDMSDSLTAYYEVTYPIPGLWLIGSYMFRGETFRLDKAIAHDDKMRIIFSSRNENIDYRKMVHVDLAGVAAAYGGYLGRGLFANYTFRHVKKHEAKVAELRASRPGCDVNGFNNIFTLNVVQYWDAELCQRALGYDRDEVITRLTGKVPLVQPLMDGVYVVFNDNPDLTFEEFCAYNNRLKPVLGLA